MTDTPEPKKVVFNKVEKKLHRAGPEIMTKGQDVHRRQRRELIEIVCEAWYNISPARAKAFMRYLDEITKVEHREGMSSGGNFHCTVRLPADLFTTLKKAFYMYYPDEPMFGQEDDDLRLLYEVAPKLFPRQAREGRGKGRR